MGMKYNWVDWDGLGDGPNEDDVVIVYYRDGLLSKGIRAKNLRWTHSGSNDDIVRYRVVR